MKFYSDLSLRKLWISEKKQIHKTFVQKKMP